MLATIRRKLHIIFRDSFLRKSIFFTLAMIAVYRFLASIPIPGIDPLVLQEFLKQNQFFSFLNLFSGGGLSQLSIIVLGVGPYITSAIIMQLMTTVSPKLKKLFHEEGSLGRRKFNFYSRLLTVPIAFIQGFGILMLLVKQGVLQHGSSFDFTLNVIIIATGAILAMWIGELITEFGVGNGVSLLIFAGIVASLPSAVSQLVVAYTPSELLNYILYGILVLGIIIAVVYVNEAERRIPITYAKHGRGMLTYGGADTYIPMKLNQAGVMPIIFALSILLFPQMIANSFLDSSIGVLSQAAHFVNTILTHSVWYPLIYFILVFVFTYFYTAITFDPESVAENLAKSGAFIPGIRPGNATIEYLARLATRITFVGATFLGIIAVLPIIILSATGNQAVAIGGTSVLIVVSVVLDLMKRLDAQIAMREY